MAPNSKSVWTPRLTFARFRQWTHSPDVSSDYAGPPPPPQLTKRTPTSLEDSSARADLQAKVDAFDKEIAELEAAAEGSELSLKEQLAGLMFTGKDVVKQVKAQEAQWDPKGDGTITKGEFRMHIRGLGVRAKNASNADIDLLFEEYARRGSNPRTSCLLPCTRAACAPRSLLLTRPLVEPLCEKVGR